MNRRILALGGLLALIGTGSALGIHAQTPPPTPPTPAPAGGQKVERHPEIRRAMHALQNAAKALQAANKDFDGHREKALDLTQQAIKECQAAIASDKH